MNSFESEFVPGEACPICGSPTYAGHLQSCPANKKTDEEKNDNANSEEPLSDERKMKWQYTQALIEDIEDQSKYLPPDAKAPYGYFLNRPIIGRDSPIKGGVYTTGDWEALVVDEKYGELNRCYEELLGQVKLLEQAGHDPKQFLLTLIFNYAKEKLKYNNEEVEKIVDSVVGDLKVVKLPIDDFILKGVGVCRHQAVLAGYLIEKFIEAGYLSGNVSVDRNMDDTDGHAWARYTTSGGKVVVLDPAQNFVGYLDDVKDDRQKGLYRWSYDRPNDIK